MIKFTYKIVIRPINFIKPIIFVVVWLRFKLQASHHMCVCEWEGHTDNVRGRERNVRERDRKKEIII